MTVLKGIQMLTQSTGIRRIKMYMGANIRETGSFTAGSGMPKMRQNARMSYKNFNIFPGLNTPGPPICGSGRGQLRGGIGMKGEGEGWGKRKERDGRKGREDGERRVPQKTAPRARDG
jgi:hypothetical protein